MNNENYIVVNGKKVELTEEQLKQLGINVEVEKKRNNPFNSKSETNNILYVIDATHLDGVASTREYYDNENWNRCMIERANSFTDKDFANQVYLHELLNRKLLKYAWDNEAEDCCLWNEDGENPHYHIYFDTMQDDFFVGANHYCCSQNIYFSSEEVAKQAIKDVIKPFMKEHSEFVWLKRSECDV